MKIVDHPYLAGVRCRSDGAVWLPVTRGSAAGPHWTFGSNKNGYRQVAFARKHYLVHRLIAEAFLGLCPEGCEIDHINRRRDDNRSENLHWVTRSENMRNRAVCLEAMRDVVSRYVDRRAYDRAYYANSPEHREKVRAYRHAHREERRAREATKYANNPEYREERRAYHRARYANDPEYREREKARRAAKYAEKKAQGLVCRKGLDGKQRWIPKDNTTNKNQGANQ